VKRTLLLFLVVAMAAPSLFGQGLVLHQSDLWTYPYKDLSDLLRMYPGMYPLDYGTFGSPKVFRPWNMDPWELRVIRDGIPQNRLYDGLYDSNLQPGNELDSLQYDFLSPGATGQIFMTTRNLPTDTPYTEFQIREGNYGFGTVDLAHAQKVYKSLTLELTARLAWSDGFDNSPNYAATASRTPSGTVGTAAQTSRLRGKMGWNMGSRWRTDLTYSGSTVKSDNLLTPTGLFTKRDEAIASVSERDSANTAFNPSLKLYLRQDRESWGQPFHAREQNGGWVLRAHAKLPHQALTFEHAGTAASMNFPGLDLRHQLDLELKAADSVGMGFVNSAWYADSKRQSWYLGKSEHVHRILSNVGVSVFTRPVLNIITHGGAAYSEEAAPIAWWRGSYLESARPLIIAPAFQEISQSYVSTGNEGAGPVDRHLKYQLGLRWQEQGAFCDVSAMAISHPGDFAYNFVSNNSKAYMSFDRYGDTKTQLGVAADARIPLRYGFRLDARWFAQSIEKDPTSTEDTRGYARLYFEHDYFSAPLIIRGHVSYEYYGQRIAFSNLGTYTLGPNAVVGFRLSASIKGVTAVWGTDNFFDESYALMPGYPMIGKEEYIAFIWRLWL
jgi:hypothetical protein